jgi:SAM-dependent methyltransferase
MVNCARRRPVPDQYRELAPFYDAWAADPSIAAMYAAWREHLLNAARERGLRLRVLVDLACGTGNSTVPWTARRGLSVIGIDRSAAMLDVARRKSTAVEWLRQDIRRFRVDVQADAVTCHFDALNHLLALDDLGRVFHRVAATLRPAGLFQFDLNTVHWLRWLHDREKMFQVGPHCFMASNVYDESTGVATFRQAWFVKRGRVYERIDVEVQERAFTDAELRRVLREAGLRLEQTSVMLRIDGKPVRTLYLASR